MYKPYIDQVFFEILPKRAFQDYVRQNISISVSQMRVLLCMPLHVYCRIIYPKCSECTGQRAQKLMTTCRYPLRLLYTITILSTSQVHKDILMKIDEINLYH